MRVVQVDDNNQIIGKPFTLLYNVLIMEKLTDWEREYIEEHLTKRVKTDCYWDNPDLAVEDVKWLLEIIKKMDDKNVV
jgi:hypothetical protein